jgi:hypothetical protein
MECNVEWIEQRVTVGESVSAIGVAERQCVIVSAAI